MNFNFCFFKVLQCLHVQSVQKETQIFEIPFWGVEIIDCINDSISVASPFNKEPNYEVFVTDLTSRSDFGVKI